MSVASPVSELRHIVRCGERQEPQTKAILSIGVISQFHALTPCKVFGRVLRLLNLSRTTRMAAASIRFDNLLLNQEEHENKNDCIDCGSVFPCSGSELCQQPEFGHLEVERGQVEDARYGTEEQHSCLRGRG